MNYELILQKGLQIPDDLRFHENPDSALKSCSVLREKFGNVKIVVMREEIEISESQLASDLKAYEIQCVMNEETHLPPNYRQGISGDSDFALGADGDQHVVWKPKNPEDDFS